MKHETKLEHTQLVPASSFLKPVLACVFLIPISLLLWTLGTLFSDSRFFKIKDADTTETCPIRWFLAIFIPVIISYKALKKQSLDLSGAFLGFFVGFLLTITSYGFMASLLFFFISSSKATHYRSELKEKLEENFKQGGQRNWIQVICNGGAASYFAIVYFLEAGSGEYPIDFHRHYRRSWLSLAVLSSIACATGDTWASELGTVVAKGTPRLVTSWKPVPRGTNGGITLAGTMFSAIGGLMVGVTYYVVSILCVDSRILENATCQWPTVFVGLFGGLMGSLIDSILGATCQFSGINESTGEITSTPRDGVKWISGVALLDNHIVNLLSSFITAVLGAFVSVALWPAH